VRVVAKDANQPFGINHAFFYARDHPTALNSALPPNARPPEPVQERALELPERAASPAELVTSSLHGDALSCLCNLAGLKLFHLLMRVCKDWHEAVRGKLREWGVLLYTRSIGMGAGKLKAQWDMPTWIDMMPDGNLLIVDSCNYRLKVLSVDGRVIRSIGRPGAQVGEISSPSSIAVTKGTASTLGRVYAAANFGSHDRRLMAFDPQSFALTRTSDVRLDAPEGMVAAEGKIFVVDTGQHRVVAFDGETLERVGSYPPASLSSGNVFMAGGGMACTWKKLSSPQDIAYYQGELFISDTRNDRIQVLSTSLSWLGVIGCRGEEPGQFIYPRGVTVARNLLYVCEQTRIQGLTLLGEPRIIVEVPGAVGLCGICSDGRRVFATDMDGHVVHQLRLTHDLAFANAHTHARSENEARAALRASADPVTSFLDDRTIKEAQRDRAIETVLTGVTVHSILGVASTASDSEKRHAVRLAMRLLHPDRTINISLQRTPQFTRLEAAFKKVNNLKDNLNLDQVQDESG